MRKYNARNLRRFHAHQIKDAGRRYYGKSLVARKLVLEKELRYPQNILPFFVKPFYLSALHCIEELCRREVYDYHEIKMRLLHLKPHAHYRRPVL
jgi:hypothetical protein